VQRDFGVIVRPQQVRAFDRDGAVAERGSFGAASDDADVLGQDKFSVLSSQKRLRERGMILPVNRIASVFPRVLCV
jgi:hypothetical protein